MTVHPASMRLRRLSTGDLSPDEVREIRLVLVAAFGSEPEERFTEEDWQHAVGGMHFVLDVDGEIAAHASVVERELHVADRALRTGYVEAVATAPSRQRRGLGTTVMQHIGSFISERYELGALGTGSHGFYERLGWITWRGPSSARIATGSRRTPDDDGYIMVLPTPRSPELDPTDPIACEWRVGDVW